MSQSFGESKTGSELIDSLQGVQYLANKISDIDERIAYVRRASGLLTVGEMLERPYMVSASTLLGRGPDDAPDDMMLFKNGLMFIGMLDSFSYVVLDGVPPIDSLAVNFASPEVIGVDEVELTSFQKLKLQVPVLEIETCILADAA